MHIARIEIYTHFFAVLPKTLEARSLIYQFAYNFVQYDWVYDPETRKNKRVVGSVWGGVTQNQEQFRYPISLLPSFMKLLERHYVFRDSLEIVRAPEYSWKPTEFTLRPEYIPRDYQEEGMAFCDEQRNAGEPSSLLMMPTGTGKTLTLLAYASRLKRRMGMVVAPTHMDKWTADFDTYLGLPADRVYTVRGGKAIQKLFILAEDDAFDYDVVLFSLATLMIFFKAYEENPETCYDLYGGTPFDIWGKAGIGLLGGDEVHESFQNVYWMHTFLHGPFHLGLSATMFHEDKFIDDMQSNIYPKTKRFDKIKMPKYIKFVNFGYRFEDMEKDKIKISFPRRSTYSQAALEGTIMKNKKVKANLFKMMDYLIQNYYIEHRRIGDKFAIYLGRNELITELVGYLKKTWPNLTIERYVEDDDYVNVISPDGRVTTRGSAGTGVDIPRLISVFSFDNVTGQQASVQLLGRLRKIADQHTIFVQLYATNLPKHQLYKKKRDELFKDRIESRIETLYHHQL